MTNYERIKEMPIDDLAVFLCEISQGQEGEGCKNCIATAHCRYHHNGMRDYLEAEAKDCP